MLNYWNDFDYTLALFDDFRRRMDHLYGSYEPRAEAQQPWMTLRDDGKDLTVLAHVPGVAQDDLKVTLHNDTLTISGERKSDVPEGYKLHRRERTPLQFTRSFTLPAKIDPEKTQAELKDGVLKLTLSRAAEAQPRMIAVKAA
jgi:HSP20 family protein